jgi:uncharacterized membrane protein (DUF4010 family)
VCKIDLSIAQSFLSAIIIGALIGMEREFEQFKKGKPDFAGLRTFIFISLLGAIVGQLSVKLENPLFMTIAFLAFTLIVVSAYIVSAMHHKKIGATTEVTALLVFCLGIMCVTELAHVAISVTVIILAFLALKKVLTKPIRAIQSEQIYATIEFALMAIVIFPLLPNKAYSPLDIPIIGTILKALPIDHGFVAQLNAFNPYIIWLMVVLVTGVGYVGYILTEIIGSKKGIGISGMIGGLVSSTAVSTTLSRESKISPSVIDACSFGVLFASATMFLKVLLFVAAVSPPLFMRIALLLVLLAIANYGVGFISLFGHRKHPAKSLGFKSPFAVLPAIKFGILFAVIIFLTKLASLTLGDAGVYAVSLISGFVGMNAITLSIANLASTAAITLTTAVRSIVLATLSNTAFKMGIAWFYGERRFALDVIRGLGAVLAFGILLLFAV